MHTMDDIYFKVILIAYAVMVSDGHENWNVLN